ncbi:kinase-like protein [Apiospora arundinis]
MREFKHVNIIEILDLKKFDTEVPEIIMPLLKGSLEDLIVEAKENDIADVQWAQICNTAAEQMLRALEYLAERKVIHRDIKPDNILYTCLDDGKVQCKLADFGLARRHGKQARGRCGTPSYQAPELYPKITKVKGDQSVKMDIYSLCGTLVTLFSKRERYPPPVEHFDPEIAVPAAMKQLQVAVGEQTMLKLMAARHPEARPSAAELLKKFYPAQRPETIDVEMEDWGVPQLKMEAPEAPEAHNIARKGVSNPYAKRLKNLSNPRGKISKTPRGARNPRAEHCMAIRTKACVAEALGI